MFKHACTFFSDTVLKCVKACIFLVVKCLSVFKHAWFFLVVKCLSPFMHASTFFVVKCLSVLKHACTFYGGVFNMHVPFMVVKCLSIHFYW